MALSTYERSVYSGRPVQLYRFYRSSGDTDFYWFYNGSDRDLWYNGVAYLATAISDEGIKQTGEAASSEFKITMPATEQFCSYFRAAGAPPSDSLWGYVFRAHAPDISDLDGLVSTVNSASLVWTGTVDGMTQSDDLKVEITCSTLATSFKRGGLRYTWMPNCPHMLYAPLTCKVDKDSFRIDTTVTAVAGGWITADGFGTVDDGWLTGGYVEFVIPAGFTERRLVNSHTGSTITVLGTVVGLSVGSAITGYAGCKRTVRACIDKFGNYDNYGGFPHIPGRSPYDGKPVYL